MDQRLPVIAEPAEAFRVFANELNFSRAAEQLFISQPALHAKIKNFEASVGVPVYRRSGRELELTPEGAALAAFISQLQLARDEFAPTIHAPRRDPVVVAAGEGAFLYLLGPVVREAMLRPGAGLRLELANADEALDSLVAGRADVAVGVMPRLPDGLDVLRLARFRQLLVAPRGHHLTRRRRVTLADLDGEPMVMPPSGRPLRRALDGELAARDVYPNVEVEVGSWALLVRFVELGVGCAIVNELIPTGPDVVTVPVADLPPAEYSAVALPAGRRDADVEAFRGALERLRTQYL